MRRSDSHSDFTLRRPYGVISVAHLYNYCKKFGYKTQVMGARLRNVNQIVRLTGADLLTISPELLGQLDQTEGVLERTVDPEKAQASGGDRLHLDEIVRRGNASADTFVCRNPAERSRQPEIARNNLHPMDWTEWWRMSSVSGIFILVEEP